MTNKVLGRVLVGLGVVLVGTQLIPVDTTNPPADGAMAMPDGEVGQLLKGACMDCHSNETVWPWYAHVTPVKFFLADHVNEGRSKLDFSTWEQRTPDRQARKLGEVADLVREGEMPLWSYSLMHPAARLTDAQRQMIVEWAEAERTRIQGAGAVTPGTGGEGGNEGAQERGEEAGDSGERGESGETGQR